MTVDAKTPTDDPFDIATRVTTVDGQTRGHTSDAYWAFIGPFGGVTAGVMLRAIVEHPERQGDPLALTVNYCAPLARGPFDLTTRAIKTNRSSQHWSVELSQNGEVAAFATAVFAARRTTWSHQEKTMPQTTPFAEAEIYPDNGAAPWVGQYQFRFTEGRPRTTSAPFETPASARSTLWIRDISPRKIDAISLASMSDAFFARIFHVRKQLLPIGTVSMTVYFHADADDIAAANTEHVLGTADASVFHKSYSDQLTELWSPDGKLLATSQQVTYFKV